MRRSPRLCDCIFPWGELSLELQAAILLHMFEDTSAIMKRLAQMAQLLRPMRPAVLCAMESDARIVAFLSKRWVATVCKLDRMPSPLSGVFWGMHRLGELQQQVEERMTVELQLRRPRSTPRSWKWIFRFAMSAACECGDELVLSLVETLYTPSTRLGLPHGTRRRTHYFWAHGGRVLAAGRDKMLQNGICPYHADTLIRPKMVTPSTDTLSMYASGRKILTWSLPDDAACVLRLVRAFV